LDSIRADDSNLEAPASAQAAEEEEEERRRRRRRVIQKKISGRGGEGAAARDR
jgi:hypothetical protein